MGWGGMGCVEVRWFPRNDTSGWRGMTVVCRSKKKNDVLLLLYPIISVKILFETIAERRDAVIKVTLSLERRGLQNLVRQSSLRRICAINENFTLPILLFLGLGAVSSTHQPPHTTGEPLFVFQKNKKKVLAQWSRRSLPGTLRTAHSVPSTTRARGRSLWVR